MRSVDIIDEEGFRVFRKFDGMGQPIDDFIDSPVMNSRSPPNLPQVID
jgi:hypothetical protein